MSSRVCSIRIRAGDELSLASLNIVPRRELWVVFRCFIGLAPRSGTASSEKWTVGVRIRSLQEEVFIEIDAALESRKHLVWVSFPFPLWAEGIEQ